MGPTVLCVNEDTHSAYDAACCRCLGSCAHVQASASTVIPPARFGSRLKAFPVFFPFPGACLRAWALFYALGGARSTRNPTRLPASPPGPDRQHASHAATLVLHSNRRAAPAPFQPYAVVASGPSQLFTHFSPLHHCLVLALAAGGGSTGVRSRQAGSLVGPVPLTGVGPGRWGRKCADIAPATPPSLQVPARGRGPLGNCSPCAHVPTVFCCMSEHHQGFFRPYPWSLQGRGHDASGARGLLVLPVPLRRTFLVGGRPPTTRGAGSAPLRCGRHPGPAGALPRRPYLPGAEALDFGVQGLAAYLRPESLLDHGKEGVICAPEDGTLKVPQ